MERG